MHAVWIDLTTTMLTLISHPSPHRPVFSWKRRQAEAGRQTPPNGWGHLSPRGCTVSENEQRAVSVCVLCVHFYLWMCCFFNSVSSFPAKGFLCCYCVKFIFFCLNPQRGKPNYEGIRVIIFHISASILPSIFDFVSFCDLILGDLCVVGLVLKMSKSERRDFFFLFSLSGLCSLLLVF